MGRSGGERGIEVEGWIGRHCGGCGDGYEVAMEGGIGLGR